MFSELFEAAAAPLYEMISEWMHRGETTLDTYNEVSVLSVELDTNSMQFFIWNSARAYDVSAPVFDTREFV